MVGPQGSGIDGVQEGKTEEGEHPGDRLQDSHGGADPYDDGERAYDTQHGGFNPLQAERPHGPRRRVEPPLGASDQPGCVER